MMSKLEKIIDAIEGAKPSNSAHTSFKAPCPAHSDKTPSLKIDELPDGRILLHCFAGCSALEILDAIGMNWGDLFPEDQPNNMPYPADKRAVARSNRTPYVNPVKELDRSTIIISEDQMKQGVRLSEPEKQSYIAAKLRYVE